MLYEKSCVKIEFIEIEIVFCYPSGNEFSEESGNEEGAVNLDSYSKIEDEDIPEHIVIKNVNDKTKRIASYSQGIILTLSSVICYIILLFTLLLEKIK